MRTIGAYGAIAALSFGLLAAPPAEAFGLRIGPFHIGIPLRLYHRHHPLYMHADRGERRPADASRDGTAVQAPAEATSVLFYPTLALSQVVQNVFWPASGSPWPFGYRDIFSAAFAKRSTSNDPSLCQRPDGSEAIVNRLRDQIAPTADQMQRLQKLGAAIDQASDYLSKSCPNEIAQRPVSRLQLMESQIEVLATAVDIIRQPLQDFEQSLNDEQKARFAAMIDAPERHDRADSAATSCGNSPAVIDQSVEQIERSVQPTDEQRPALDAVKKSLSDAANALDTHCPTAVPPTAFGRLQAIEARLDATSHAVLAIQVALGNFETKLSDEQKGRFDNMQFAAK